MRTFEVYASELLKWTVEDITGVGSMSVGYGVDWSTRVLY